MVQKLQINNFGPVRHAEIEIKPLLVLIGEQASGKSTIAKLIYFFKSLSSEFLSSFYQSEEIKIEFLQHVILPVRQKFYDFFGSTFHMGDFTLIYHYSEQRSITLTRNENKKLEVTLSQAFFSKSVEKKMMKCKQEIIEINKQIGASSNVTQKMALNGRLLEVLRKLSDSINKQFCTPQANALYILAGRNATVGYGDFFEKALYQNLQKNIELQGANGFRKKEQTIDETLMLSFMQHVSEMKLAFSKNGDFDGMIHNTEEEKKVLLEYALTLIQGVLHGKYANSSFGERIEHQDGFVYLRNASSGQQEAIRIVQDAFLSIYQDEATFRIVEEPEAHLFPTAQKSVIELLVLSRNARKENQLVVTTHSPYTLTVINNLIYAYQTGQRNMQEVNDTIRKELWVNPDDVAAYLLNNGTATDIMDEDLRQIRAELIDGVSKEINAQYDKLLEFDDNEGE